MATFAIQCPVEFDRNNFSICFGEEFGEVHGAMVITLGVLNKLGVCIKLFRATTQEESFHRCARSECIFQVECHFSNPR